MLSLTLQSQQQYCVKDWLASRSDTKWYSGQEIWREDFPTYVPMFDTLLTTTELMSEIQSNRLEQYVYSLHAFLPSPFRAFHDDTYLLHNISGTSYVRGLYRLR